MLRVNKVTTHNAKMAADSKSTDAPTGVHITVTGGGTFATALAVCFARNGANVLMFMRSEDTVKVG